MAAKTIDFAGFVYDDSGDAISGATVNIYDKNSTSTTRQASTITTNSSGYWSYSHSTMGEFDAEIVAGGGASKRRIKFDDKIYLTQVDTQALVVRGASGAAATSYIMADRGDDAADAWEWKVADAGVMTLGNDIASQGTYVAHVTVTPNSTAASSTFAIAGHATVGGNLTVTGTATFNGGTITIGDAATDNIVFGANIDSHAIPDDDDTYDLGSSTQKWRNLYVDGTGMIDALDVDATADFDVSDFDVASSGDIDLVSTANTAGSITIHANGGTSESILIRSDQGTTATEGSASVQLLSDVGGINIKSGLNAANAILLTADGGTSETIKIHSDQGTGAASIELASDAGGVTVGAGGAIILDAATDITLDADGDNITFKAGSGDSTGLDFSNSSGTWTVKAGTSDADIIFKVNDGGTSNTVMTLDASESVVVIGGNATKAGEIRILEDTDAGSNYAAIKVPNLSANYTLTLPTDDGTADQVLATDGNGALSWADAGGGAWERIGGSSGESSGSGDSASALFTLGSQSIAAGTLLKIFCGYRKASTTGSYAAQLGLVLDGAYIIPMTTVSPTNTSAESGIVEFTVIWGRANYLQISMMEAFDSASPPNRYYGGGGSGNMGTGSLAAINVYGGPSSGVTGSNVYLTDVQVYKGATS
jgi:hypothetical protein